MEVLMVIIVIVHVIGWALAVVDSIGHRLGILRDDETWFVINHYKRGR